MGKFSYTDFYCLPFHGIFNTVCYLWPFLKRCEKNEPKQIEQNISQTPHGQTDSSRNLL